MAQYIECSCRGCAECIGCGRDRDKYMVYVCDRCGQESTMLNFIYQTGADGKDYCVDCVARMEEESEEE